MLGDRTLRHNSTLRVGTVQNAYYSCCSAQLLAGCLECAGSFLSLNTIACSVHCRCGPCLLRDNLRTYCSSWFCFLYDSLLELILILILRSKTHHTSPPRSYSSKQHTISFPVFGFAFGFCEVDAAFCIHTYKISDSFCCFLYPYIQHLGLIFNLITPHCVICSLLFRHHCTSSLSIRRATQSPQVPQSRHTAHGAGVSPLRAPVFWLLLCYPCRSLLL